MKTETRERFSHSNFDYVFFPTGLKKYGDCVLFLLANFVICLLLYVFYCLYYYLLYNQLQTLNKSGIFEYLKVQVCISLK
jgi:hypothetical protein